MDRFSVFAPKLLPKTEGFLPAVRSCPGCGQAASVRLIGKAMTHYRKIPYGSHGPGLHASAVPYNQWKYPPSRKAGHALPAPDTDNVTAAAGESGTFSDGFHLLQQARVKRKRFLYICLFNESGLERHKTASEPCYTHDRTKGFLQRFHHIRSIIETVQDIGPEYLATACPSYPFDLIEKVHAALDTEGISFIAVLAPCPSGCRYEPSLSLESGRRAVESGLFPLYRVEDGILTGSVPVCRPLPVTEYVKLQPRAAETHRDEIAQLQREADKLAVLTKKIS